MAAISISEGAYLVGLARQAIGEYFQSGKKLIPNGHRTGLPANGGLFVALHTYPGRELRGCTGQGPGQKVPPSPSSLVDVALSAAFEPPRFAPLEKEEFGRTIVEVSVLGPQERLLVKNPEEYPRKIRVGRDGLAISYGYASGLILPQTAVEWNWSEREFLSHLCREAGLPPDMWKSPSVSIVRFSAQVFAEEKPGGKVVLRKLFR